MKLRWFHIHTDRNWRAGIHCYYQCRCGARRTRRLYRNIDGPERAGWPILRDSHGMSIDDTGWKKD